MLSVAESVFCFAVAGKKGDLQMNRRETVLSSAAADGVPEQDPGRFCCAANPPVFALARREPVPEWLNILRQMNNTNNGAHHG